MAQRASASTSGIPDGGLPSPHPQKEWVRRRTETEAETEEEEDQDEMDVPLALPLPFSFLSAIQASWWSGGSAAGASTHIPPTTTHNATVEKDERVGSFSSSGIPPSPPPSFSSLLKSYGWLADAWKSQCLTAYALEDLQLAPTLALHGPTAPFPVHTRVLARRLGGGIEPAEVLQAHPDCTYTLRFSSTTEKTGEKKPTQRRVSVRRASTAARRGASLPSVEESRRGTTKEAEERGQRAPWRVGQMPQDDEDEAEETMEVGVLHRDVHALQEGEALLLSRRHTVREAAEEADLSLLASPDKDDEMGVHPARPMRNETRHRHVPPAEGEGDVGQEEARAAAMRSAPRWAFYYYPMDPKEDGGHANEWGPPPTTALAPPHRRASTRGSQTLRAEDLAKGTASSSLPGGGAPHILDPDTAVDFPLRPFFFSSAEMESTTPHGGGGEEDPYHLLPPLLPPSLAHGSAASLLHHFMPTPSRRPHLLPLSSARMDDTYCIIVKKPKKKEQKEEEEKKTIAPTAPPKEEADEAKKEGSGTTPPSPPAVSPLQRTPLAHAARRSSDQAEKTRVVPPALSSLSPPASAVASTLGTPSPPTHRSPDRPPSSLPLGPVRRADLDRVRLRYPDALRLVPPPLEQRGIPPTLPFSSSPLSSFTEEMEAAASGGRPLWPAALSHLVISSPLFHLPSPPARSLPSTPVLFSAFSRLRASISAGTVLRSVATLSPSFAVRSVAEGGKGEAVREEGTCRPSDPLPACPISPRRAGEEEEEVKGEGPPPRLFSSSFSPPDPNAPSIPAVPTEAAVESCSVGDYVMGMGAAAGPGIILEALGEERYVVMLLPKETEKTEEEIEEENEKLQMFKLKELLLWPSHPSRASSPTSTDMAHPTFSPCPTTAAAPPTASVATSAPPWMRRRAGRARQRDGIRGNSSSSVAVVAPPSPSSRLLLPFAAASSSSSPITTLDTETALPWASLPSRCPPPRTEADAREGDTTHKRIPHRQGMRPSASPHPSKERPGGQEKEGGSGPLLLPSSSFSQFSLVPGNVTNSPLLTSGLTAVSRSVGGGATTSTTFLPHSFHSLLSSSRYQQEHLDEAYFFSRSVTTLYGMTHGHAGYFYCHPPFSMMAARGGGRPSSGMPTTAVPPPQQDKDDVGPSYAITPLHPLSPSLRGGGGGEASRVRRTVPHPSRPPPWASSSSPSSVQGTPLESPSGVRAGEGQRPPPPPPFTAHTLPQSIARCHRSADPSLTEHPLQEDDEDDERERQWSRTGTHRWRGNGEEKRTTATTKGVDRGRSARATPPSSSHTLPPFSSISSSLYYVFGRSPTAKVRWQWVVQCMIAEEAKRYYSTATAPMRAGGRAAPMTPSSPARASPSFPSLSALPPPSRSGSPFASPSSPTFSASLHTTPSVSVFFPSPTPTRPSPTSGLRPLAGAAWPPMTPTHEMASSSSFPAPPCEVEDPEVSAQGKAHAYTLFTSFSPWAIVVVPSSDFVRVTRREHLYPGLYANPLHVRWFQSLDPQNTGYVRWFNVKRLLHETLQVDFGVKDENGGGGKAHRGGGGGNDRKGKFFFLCAEQLQQLEAFLICWKSVRKEQEEKNNTHTTTNRNSSRSTNGKNGVWKSESNEGRYSPHFIRKEASELRLNFVEFDYAILAVKNMLC